MKKLSGLAREGCTLDIALLLLRFNARAQLILIAKLIWNILISNNKQAEVGRSQTEEAETSIAREQLNPAKPVRQPPKSCGLGANLKPVPETRRAVGAHPYALQVLAYLKPWCG